MPVSKRKKSTKLRGNTTHGFGSMKKNRGAGNRGGRGNAGSGKRADHKRISFLKEHGNKYFGRRGFLSRGRNIKKEKTINLFEIDSKIEKMGKKEGDIYVIDLSKYDKILGTGKITHKAKITSNSFSKKATEKIEKAGGEAILCQG